MNRPEFQPEWFFALLLFYSFFSIRALTEESRIHPLNLTAGAAQGLSYCVSHVKDIDGISSAAMTRAATGAEVTLTDYGRVMEDLRAVPREAKSVIICDLGVDASETEPFITIMGSLADRAQVTYIDHHYLPVHAKARIRRSGVRFVHDEGECASILTFLTFRDILRPRSELIALYGAVTDEMDYTPEASRLMETTDRHFVLAEACLLSQALSFKAEREGFPDMLVRELSTGRLPHEIEGVPESALKQIGLEAKLMDEVKRHGKRVGRLAYMDTTEYSSGIVAKLLLGAFKVPVGVAVRENKPGELVVELRGTSECRVHLGMLIGEVSSKLGGSGGGHRLASGGIVPTDKESRLLRMLSRKV